MLPPVHERKKLEAILAQLTSAVEELFLSGLTTASAGTRQMLMAAMQEAARYRLLRLGSTLRTAAEEMSRFTSQDPNFSRQRLTFFLSRAWLLSRGLARALQTDNEAEYDRLAWSPTTIPVKNVDAVCLGVVKRVAANAFVAFEFRLRALTDAGPISAGQRLLWSAVFPIKPGMDIPPEGFLHLPQKQKFNPAWLLDRKVITLTNANLARDDSGDRLSLTDASTVTIGDSFSEWEQFLDWSPTAVVARIRAHAAGPLDLDSELQEELVLREYVLGEPTEGDSPGQTFYPIVGEYLPFTATVSSAADGKTLRTCLDLLRNHQGNPPPLYGLLHYERCRLVLQPLTAFRPEPEYLTISKENINKAALLKALSFH